jgi:hypothetical protein
MYVVIFTLLVVGLGVLIAALDCLEAWWDQRQGARSLALDSASRMHSRKKRRKAAKRRAVPRAETPRTLH